MTIILNEDIIQALIQLPKDLPSNYQHALSLRSFPEKSQRRAELHVTVDAETQFVVKLRQVVLDTTDFSAIFGYCIPHSNRVFHLRRYNGRHKYENKLEHNLFLSYHIHQATERYQNVDGADVEAFAEPTDKYADINGALELMLQECNFIKPSGSQLNLV